MTSPQLDNLVKIGQLKQEPAAAGEVEGLRRFDLVYNAAHALALAALRRLGYRSHNRYLVFQVLPHTLGMPATAWRVMAKGHEMRNLAEYEGAIDVDERLVTDMVDAAHAVLAALRAIGPPTPGA